MRSNWRVIFASMIFCAGLGSRAHAALGDDVQSVEADRTHMKASLRTVDATQYSVHQLLTPSGTTIKEFVSPAGKVFAVAWQGPFVPDLRQLLGGYFEAYKTAPPARLVRRRFVQVNTADLVAYSAGRPRSFYGHAYVPSLLPAGVTPDQIK